MLGIRVKEGERESALRRFKRVVEKAGILAEVKKRERYETPSKKRQKAMAAAIKRLNKKKQREEGEFEGGSGRGGRGGRGRGGRGGRSRGGRGGKRH